MTLLARRREELRGERAPEAVAAKARSVAARPPQPRPSFLHLQSAIGNHATGGWLRGNGAAIARARATAATGARQRGGAGDVVAFELGAVLGLAGLLPEPPRAARAPRRLLVPDGAAAAGGQMTRSAFLAAMRDAARAAAERGLAGSGHTARDCPWIEHYVRYYRQQSAARIEADLRRYLPAASAAASAEQLLVIAAEHVGASVRRWASTGELVGVPRDLPGAGLVTSVQAQLGGGHPLPASARSRMERAFGGARFADVRLHTDAVAVRLARRLRTRAFAVGAHVAFDRGEYRPGTVVGDAVLAHELAHTLQQRGAEAAPRGAVTSTPRVEHGADSAAAGVMARLWGGGRALAQKLAARPVQPGRSGLALAACREDFSEPELRQYLDQLQQHGPQKGIQDDNRARDVVRKNRKPPGIFVLTDKQVLGMIEDMLDGDTGEDDQNAIFELLDGSNAARLRYLFTNGITSKRLRTKLTKKGPALASFFDRRFEGGGTALDLGDVRPIPDEDLVERPIDRTDAKRGFRPDDLAKLEQQGVSLTFGGSLSPLPDDAQRRLLANLDSTIRFVLDPTNPDRIAEVQALQAELAANPNGPHFATRAADTPGERIDSTDLYHGHVCVPQSVLDSNERLRELRKAALAYHGFGGNLDVADTIEDDIRLAQGTTTTVTPTTRRMADTIKAVVDKHHVPFLKALGALLEALKTVPEAGVLYHTFEHVRPKVAGKPLPDTHPIRHIFTPLATNKPTFKREGTPDCRPLINFSFLVNRRGQITLLPGAESEMVRAFELLQGREDEAAAKAKAKPAGAPSPPPGGKP